MSSSLFMGIPVSDQCRGIVRQGVGMVGDWVWRGNRLED